MSERKRTLVAIVAIAVVTALFCAQAGLAQQKRSFTYKNPAGKTTYTQQHVIEVGDLPGHQIRILELHVVPEPADAQRYEGIRVKESWTRGFSDYTYGTGPASGYSVDILENGDKIFSRWTGSALTTIAADDRKDTTFTGAYTITGGTGGMRGIRGTGSNTNRLEFRDGKVVSNEEEGRAEYWFE